MMMKIYEKNERIFRNKKENLYSELDSRHPYAARAGLTHRLPFSLSFIIFYYFHNKQRGCANKRIHFICSVKKTFFANLQPLNGMLSIAFRLCGAFWTHQTSNNYRDANRERKKNVLTSKKNENRLAERVNTRRKKTSTDLSMSGSPTSLHRWSSCIFESIANIHKVPSEIINLSLRFFLVMFKCTITRPRSAWSTSWAAHKLIDFVYKRRFGHVNSSRTKTNDFVCLKIKCLTTF